MVASGVVDDVSVSAALELTNEKTHWLIPELQLDYEESDWRIVPHLLWNIKNFFASKCAIVILNDTDVVVLLTHYYYYEFKHCGLEQ